MSLTAMLLLAGCATTRRYPVTASLPVRLVSPTPFLVHVRARADTAATSCAVLRLTGSVSAVRRDTMEFASVWSDQRPRDADDCLQGRPGFLVLSSAPDLQGETAKANNGRTAVLVVVTGVLTAIGTLVLVLTQALD
ncbi:MAG: hypothetical protein IT357_12295 [Gemmatimonadaceae bacterium]|nr:hypothetical protein [Gemmatimonadaceae bacterium]